MPAEHLPAPLPDASTPAPEPIVVTNPEIVYATRVPSPEPARPLPAVRRGIFFDVENSSRPEHVAAVLDHLEIDWTTRATELVAVGNWRVASGETARLLARRGAQLVHSAPAAGVRDWSDLRIAVAAGAWLAAARPGDTVEIISDDQAFDAVGDAAASLGVRFHRLSFRSLAGIGREVSHAPAPAGESRGPRRGWRRSSGGHRGDRPHPPASPREPQHRPAPPPPSAPVASTDDAHTASANEILRAVEDLLSRTPSGVTLDALSNTLKARGFRRPPGSPRLVTRLRRLKSLEVTRNGIVRLVETATAPEPEPAGAADPVAEVVVAAEVEVESEGPEPGNEAEPKP
ncbi:MAG: hypothetical protein L0027_16380, partial [Candidatus Rokubacteria bacterium]|nr:hypothetical protein [Candidatus Rokubacteria bacterium]